MKEVIVLVATIVLGLFIAGLVLGFQEDAEGLAQKSTAGIESLADIVDDAGVKNSLRWGN